MSGGNHVRGYGQHLQQQLPYGGQQVQQQASNAGPAAATTGSNRRTFTGVVSKILDNFGFVDDEVFFQLSVFRGDRPVKTGDNVFVDCSFSEHLPFKWNASLVELVDGNNSSNSGMPSVSSTFYGTGVSLQGSNTGSSNVSSSSSTSRDPRSHHHQPQQDPRQDPRTNRNNPPSTGSSVPSVASNVKASQDQQGVPYASRKPGFLNDKNPNSVPLGSASGGEMNGQNRMNPYHGVQQNSNVVNQGLQQQQMAFASVGLGGPSSSQGSRDNQITYTSTPGSAFVQPFVDQMNPAMMQQVAPMGSSRGVPNTPMAGLTVAGVMGIQQTPIPGLGAGVSASSGNSRESRWDNRSDRDQGNSKRNNRRDRRRSRSNERDRSRRDRSPKRDRGDNYPGRVNVGGGPGKDQFGRDLPAGEVIPDEPKREDRGDSREGRREDRDRHGNLRNTHNRSTVSPSNSVASRYDSVRGQDSSSTNYIQIGKCDNIPRESILKKQMNTTDIRNRYGSKITVPSDFEVILVNSDIALDIHSIPKPIKFKFLDVKKPSSNRDKSEKKDESKDADKNKSEKKETSGVEVVIDEYKAAEDEETPEEGDKESLKQEETTEASSEKELIEDNTEATIDESKKAQLSEPKKIKKHEIRYSAKVILLSLPEMNEMYEKVFGYDFVRSSYGFSTERSYPLSKLISFVTQKNISEGGYSLLGGKFVEEKDGFIGDCGKPNLIQTAVRTVKESTGIDLSNCTQWVSLGTFVYNRRTCVDGESDQYEYSTIFLPDVWSILGKESSVPEVIETVKEGATVTSNEEVKIEETVTKNLKEEITPGESAMMVNEPAKEDTTTSQASEGAEVTQKDEPNNVQQQYIQNVLPNLTVAKLKAELDNLDIKYSKTAKKADLVALLKEHLESKTVSKPEENEIYMTDDEEFVDANDTSPLKKKEAEEAASVEEQTEDEVNKDGTSETPTTEKRKCHDEPAKEEPPAKKTKSSPTIAITQSAVVKDRTIEVSSEVCLSCLSLYQGLNHHKNDHFELSVSAELLKEALIKNFGSFILSTLKENQAILKQESRGENSSVRRGSKPPTLVQLIFSFFDDKHFGYMSSQEALQLISSSLTGFSFSKRLWTNLTAGVDRIYYRNLEAPKTDFLFKQAFVDPLGMKQETRPSGGNQVTEQSSSVYFKNGIMYDVNNLVDQSHEFMKTQVVIKDLQSVIAEKTILITEYESKQRKMTNMIEKTNDELCSLKKEKESLSKRNEEARKVFEASLETLTRGTKLFKSNSKESSSKEKEEDKSHRKSSSSAAENNPNGTELITL